MLDERELDLHFQSLRKEHHSAHIIDVDPAPENGQAAAHGTKTHDLPIRIKHLYHVSKAHLMGKIVACADAGQPIRHPLALPRQDTHTPRHATPRHATRTRLLPAA